VVPYQIEKPWRLCWSPSCRGCPLLPGAPTSVHSPLRQAIAIVVRLGCPLQQIGYTYLALARNPGGYRPGLQIYTLAKGRTVTLGHAVSSAFSCGVSAGSPAVH
jgi:hypothetical protein